MRAILWVLRVWQLRPGPLFLFQYIHNVPPRRVVFALMTVSYETRMLAKRNTPVLKRIDSNPRNNMVVK
jgi:hypothetical protein